MTLAATAAGHAFDPVWWAARVLAILGTGGVMALGALPWFNRWGLVDPRVYARPLRIWALMTVHTLTVPACILMGAMYWAGLPHTAVPRALVVASAGMMALR